MTTKKKNSPSDRESKAESFREAQRQDQRVEELWGRSSPTMKKMFAAFEQFRTSFDKALADVDGFVSESERVSGELRKEQCEAKADALDGWADEWAEVTSKEFREASTGIVDLVRDALVTGYPDHVLTLAKRLRLRGRAEWGRLCESQRYVLRTVSPPKKVRKTLKAFAKTLIGDLKQIDDRAASLRVEQVVEAANGRTETGSGFAAELACICGAFDYRSDDQQKAQKAIDQAMKRAA
jgi:hypothetical protein